MQAFVNGMPASPQSFGVPAMNFGQPRPNATEVRYEFVFTRDELLRLAQRAYAQLVTELRADRSDDEEEWPELQRLRQLEFPSLDAVVDHEPAVAEMLLRRWINLELLNAINPAAALADGPLYAFHSIDEIELGHGTARLRGQAYRVR